MTHDVEPPLPRDTAIDVLSQVIKKQKIDAMTFFYYREAPPVQASLSLNVAQRDLVAAALELRRSIGLSFTESVILRMTRTGSDPSMLYALMRHFDPDVKTVEVSDTPDVDLLALFSERKELVHVAVASRVRVHDQTRHIPMLDFRCRPSPQGQELARDILKAIDAPKGYLLQSGRSYHYYGDELMSAIQLRSFLGRALLFSPAVDRGWIAHQLMQGMCALRISPRGSDGWPVQVARI